MRRTLAALGLLVVAGCQTDYTFATVAVYEAPRSGCAVRIEGSGVVRAGHDVSSAASGRLTLGPLGQAHAGRAPSVLQVALREGRVEIASVLGVEGDVVNRDRAFLSRLVSQAGCAPVAEEVDELASAIEGVLLGPKGTLMEGQSRALRVVSTTFDRQ